jgi:hypothetical protein
MSLWNKLWRSKKKEEEEVLKTLDELDKAEANAREGDNLEGLADASDLEKQWLQRRSGNQDEGGGTEEYGKGQGKGQEEEQEQEVVRQDELISDLKKEEEEEEEEIDLVIRNVMEEMGNVGAKEILELGREVLEEMRGKRGQQRV